jgi:hypothetical protein
MLERRASSTCLESPNALLVRTARIPKRPEIAWQEKFIDRGDGEVTEPAEHFRVCGRDYSASSRSRRVLLAAKIGA